MQLWGWTEGWQSPQGGLVTAAPTMPLGGAQERLTAPVGLMWLSLLWNTVSEAPPDTQPVRHCTPWLRF